MTFFVPQTKIFDRVTMLSASLDQIASCLSDIGAHLFVQPKLINGWIILSIRPQLFKG